MVNTNNTHAKLIHRKVHHLVEILYMVNTSNKHSMLIHMKVQALVETLFIW